MEPRFHDPAALLAVKEAFLRKLPAFLASTNVRENIKVPCAASALRGLRGLTLRIVALL